MNRSCSAIESLNALVIGYGSIARRHVRNLRTLVPNAQVIALRREDTPAPEGVDAVVTDWDRALAHQPRFALVTSPAPRHLDDTRRALEAELHVLVEKPLATSLDGIQELRVLAERVGKSVLVAYPFRFHRPLRLVREAVAERSVGDVLSIRAEVGMYLPDWRPGTDYRSTVSAVRALGGGALFELSHEFDVVRWLVGDVDRVFAHTGRVSDLEIDVEDIADVLLRFESGAHGSIHLDFLQRIPHRALRVVGSAGTITWQLDGDRARVWCSGQDGWTDLSTTPPDRNEMYLAEMAHLLDCVQGTAHPRVSLMDGEAALRVALAAHASAASSTWAKP